MSSGSILPTFGAAPPDIRRAPIPRDLQPGGARKARPVPQQLEPRPLAASVPRGYLAESFSAPTKFQAPGDAVADGPAQGSRPVSVAALAVISAQEDGSTSHTEPLLPASQNRATDNGSDADSGRSAASLSDDEQAYVSELKAIDREVRAHEASHASAGGGFAGRPTYEFVTGPDGIRYAVSGSVEIDTGTVGGDPSATIRKLETVRRAALAPAKPSGQDRAVAAQAEAGIRAAQAELNADRAGEQTDEPLTQTDAEPLGGGVNQDEFAQVNGQLDQVNGVVGGSVDGASVARQAAQATFDLLA